MEIRLSLEALRDSGLPIDWMTLKVGVDGIELGDWSCIRTRRDEIKEYALEVLAPAVGTSDEEPIFLIADADLTDWQSLDRPLALLAERSGIRRAVALRKWRYASVSDYVATCRLPDFTKIHNYWEDETHYDLLWFKHQWEDIEGGDSLPEDANAVDMEEAMRNELQSLRDWLAEEGRALGATYSGANDSR